MLKNTKNITKYYKIFLKKCRKLKPKPKYKQYQTRHISVFDCLPIYYLLIRSIPDSTFLVYLAVPDPALLGFFYFTIICYLLIIAIPDSALNIYNKIMLAKIQTNYRNICLIFNKLMEIY